MKRFLAAAVLAVSAQSVAAQTLSDADVAAALQLAHSKPGDYMVTSMSGPHDVTVVGRLGRIAVRAAIAKKEYRDFQVTDDLRRDEVWVDVTVDTPVYNAFSGYYIPSPISHVVLRGKDGTIIQPLEIVPTPQEWSNAVGAKLTANGASVRFPSFPVGDFDVVLIKADTREDVYKIKGKDRLKLK